VEDLSTPPSRSGFLRRNRAVLAVVATVTIGLVVWIGYGVISENLRLQGKWRVLRLDGSKILQDDGTFEITLSWSNSLANPFTDPKSLNVNRKVGGGFGTQTYKCIYQWEGNRIRFAEATPGVRRPQSFDPNQEVVFEPGTGGGGLGVGLLERVKEEE